jgi:hypothetical protein
MLRILAAAVAVLALFALASSQLVDQRDGIAEAASGGEEMLLNIPGGDCDDATRPTTCDVDAGGTFTLSVEAFTIPAAGYFLAEAWVDFGADLVYKAAPATIDEVTWPDCDPEIALRGQLSATSMHIGCITALTPPLPLSLHTGSLFEIPLTCPASSGSHLVSLLQYGGPVTGTTGTQYVIPEQTRIIPKVNNLTVNCVAVAPLAVGGVALDGELRAVSPSVGAAPTSTSGPWLAAALAAAAATALVLGALMRRRRA